MPMAEQPRSQKQTSHTPLDSSRPTMREDNSFWLPFVLSVTPQCWEERSCPVERFLQYNLMDVPSAKRIGVWFAKSMSLTPGRWLSW